MTIPALIRGPRTSHNPRGRVCGCCPRRAPPSPVSLGITKGGNSGLGTSRSSRLSRRRSEPDPGGGSGARHQHGHHHRRCPRRYGRRSAWRHHRGRQPGAHREGPLDRQRRARPVPAVRTSARRVHLDVLARQASRPSGTRASSFGPASPPKSTPNSRSVSSRRRSPSRAPRRWWTCRPRRSSARSRKRCSTRCPPPRACSALRR